MKRLAVAIIIFIILLSLPVFFLGHVWSKLFVNTANSTSNKSIQTSAQLDEHFKMGKPYNILFLGNGGGTHEGAYLTDSILDVNIDPLAKKITLISIPRDIWVQFPDSFNIGDHWKVNTAFAIGVNNKDFPQKPKELQGSSGGISLEKYAVSQIIGRPVDRVVLADFDGFVKAMDQLGGIDVSIDKTFDDYQYPVDGKENDTCGKSNQELSSLKGIELANPEKIFPCRYEHLHFNKGVSHLNGNASLKLARSRHSSEDGTDFARSARQRNILIAIKKKINSLSILPDAFPLLDLLGDHVKTDIALSEIETLIAHRSEIESYSIHDIALTNSNFLRDSSNNIAGYILIPRDGTDQWDAVHAWINSQL